MAAIVKRVTGGSAGESELGGDGQEFVADGDDGGGVDGSLEPLASSVGPAGDEGAVAEFGHRGGGQEELVAGEQRDL